MCRSHDYGNQKDQDKGKELRIKGIYVAARWSFRLKSLPRLIELNNHIRYPVAGSPTQPLIDVFPVEIGGRNVELHRLCIIEGQDVDDGVEAAFDFADRKRHSPTPTAHEKLGRGGAESIPAQAALVNNLCLEPCS